MSILFLFGAGASNGSMDCLPYPPPLSCTLFDDLVKVGRIASTVNTKLAVQFQYDFEEGMDQFFKEHNEDVIGFLREMAQYFAQFQPGPMNLYIKLIKSLMKVNDEVIFSTTNYELLIEMAAILAGLTVDYFYRPFPKNTLQVLKIHGSCNFLPVMEGALKDVKFRIPSTLGALVEAQVRIVNSPQQIIQFCQTEDSATPAVAMFASSKWVPVCRKFVEQQQAYWQNEVYRASHIFIIGSGVHVRDAHIWDPLEHSLGSLTYVGPTTEEFIKWANNKNRSSVDVIESSFDEAIDPIIKKCLNFH